MGWGAASSGVRDDLRITVRASPSGVTHLSSTPQPVEQPVELLKERAGPSVLWALWAYASVPPLTNRMSIAASEGEPYLSGDDDQDALPPSGVGSVVRARPRDDAYAFPGR